MTRYLLAAVIPALLALGASQAQQEDTERKVKMRDLPPAVQEAVKKHSAGAKLSGLAQESENGKVFYEAELKVNGRTRDITFDETGKLVAVEQEIALADVPAAAREALRSFAGDGKIGLVESIEKGGQTYYEAHIRKDGKEVEFKVDAQGQEVK